MGSASIDATLARWSSARGAADNGDSICSNKTAIGGYGSIALVKDSKGDMIGLHRMHWRRQGP